MPGLVGARMGLFFEPALHADRELLHRGTASQRLEGAVPPEGVGGGRGGGCAAGRGGGGGATSATVPCYSSCVVAILLVMVLLMLLRLVKSVWSCLGVCRIW